MSKDTAFGIVFLVCFIVACYVLGFVVYRLGGENAINTADGNDIFWAGFRTIIVLGILFKIIHAFTIVF